MLGNAEQHTIYNRNCVSAKRLCITVEIEPRTYCNGEGVAV